jgi:hypothetical protein
LRQPFFIIILINFGARLKIIYISYTLNGNIENSANAEFSCACKLIQQMPILEKIGENNA